MTGVPRVSVGLPVHNGEPFLTRALDTLLAQTVTEIDVVISDNCSTDGTERICRDYAARDPRVRYERQDVNRGAAWNFNRVLERADPAAPYFLWAAADDERDPGYLAATAALLDADPTAAGAHAATADIDDEGYVLHEYEAADEFGGVLADGDPAVRFAAVVALGHQCFPLLGLLRQDVVRSTRGLGGYSDADNVLLAEIVLRGRILHAEPTLFFRRQHPQRSMRSFADQRERDAWFDPAKAGSATSPMWRLVREFTAAVREAPITPAERNACYRASSIFFRRNWMWLTKSVVKSATRQVGTRKPSGGRQLATPRPGGGVF